MQERINNLIKLGVKMAHTIVGKLNKPANEIPTQKRQQVLAFTLGVQYYD